MNRTTVSANAEAVASSLDEMPVKFEWSAINSIKSISQRALLLQWYKVRGSRKLPALTEFGSNERLHDSKQLMIWSVEHADPNSRRFKGLAQGKDFLDIFGVAYTGQYMDEITPQSLRPFALDAANECVGRSSPVYHIISSRDDEGQTIDCERLLLPFGNAEVTQMLVSLQLISLYGAFDKKTVLKSFVKHAETSLAVCIGTGQDDLR